jgi:glucosyl-dolichyl phosphate glucuronosyltransferase
MLDISVIICAYTEDRWGDTLAAVDSVRQQEYPAAEIIVVVDHNPALYQRLRESLPDITIVENSERQGLSGGKNTGVSSARGEIVAFLDDDAVASSCWLRSLADTYADPCVIGAGGLTLPAWDTQRPSWFAEEFDWVVGCSYVGMPRSRGKVRNLHGGNASFRRAVFDVIGGFSNGIGRSASKQPHGCEETEFCIRLNQHLPESVLLFDDRAIIWHRVSAERCRFSYFRTRCYSEGRSKALVAASVGATDGLSTERKYMVKTLPLGVLRGCADALRGQPDGLGRSATIIIGLLAAVTGFTIGTLQRRLARSTAPSPEHASEGRDDTDGVVLRTRGTAE